MNDVLADGEPRLYHAAVFYHDTGEYLREVSGFVQAGLDGGEPVFVAVPETRIRLLRDHLGAQAGRVTFADMTRMGANPAWIIPVVREFVDAYPGRPVCYVGEPVWETRTTEELNEATRHEALINLAFADAPARILCPYDTARLGPAALAAAEHTHPVVIRGGCPRPSPDYTGTAVLPAECDQPLPAPPGHAAALAYHHSLAPVRAFVAYHASRAGLAPARTADLVLAAHELTANTLRHTEGGGTLHVWAAPGEVICQVRDSGHIHDPLVGRRRPAAEASHGQGMWVVHQVCDLVELRTGPDGSTIRLHMRYTEAAPTGYQQ
jgi:anti-sigma regulatory factor (Ser/Thr protein kinase)